MTQYNVTGMSCAACSARVEKAVNSVEGVTSCAVSLLTNSMGVEGTATPEQIISAVTKAGYGASVKGSGNSSSSAITETAESLEDTETPKLIKRLTASVVVLIVLMYFAMGHNMFGFPLPSFFETNAVATALVQLLLTIIVIIINNRFFISGFKAVIHKSPNMDTLVAMGSSASFLWSLYILFKMTASPAAASELISQLYFESSAMILTLITVGKTLEARSKGRTTDALKDLIELTPKTATIEKDGTESVIPANELKTGDIFIVRPGDAIPSDGFVTEGSSAVNESALTGESIPSDKTAGDTVFAGTINQSGFLRCRATLTAGDTKLSQIIKTVNENAATKAPIAKIADMVSGIFVPAVISVAVLVIVIWCIVGKDFGYSLARGISVLVISCPCALGLATPVAIMVGSGKGAKNGILFKTAASLEQAGRIKTIALDKTGTVTEGKPSVTDIIPADGIPEKQLLSYANALEKFSEHPLAHAVTDKCSYADIDNIELTGFETLPGNGLKALHNGKVVYAGNLRFISENCSPDENVKIKALQLSSKGKTPLLFAYDNCYLGMIAVADTIRDDSVSAISKLKSMGIHTVMLTGDNENTAKAIAEKAGIDEVISGVLPDEKSEYVKKLSLQSKTAMVGDGINDAPALTSADLGIAIGSGTDIAIDSADIVVMNSNLTSVVNTITLGRRTLKNIRENLFWAFFYNAICIPLAAGAFVPLGITLNPMIGAAAMSLSSFCVVTNALKLNLIKFNNEKELNKMEKTMKIKGMMCPHCEATVKKALEAIDGVEKAEPNHKKDVAVVTLSSDVDDAVLTKAVTDAGYEVKKIK